jgi:hypothetical protein
MAEMSGFERDENGALVTGDGPGEWKAGFVRSANGGLVVTLPPSAVSRDDARLGLVLQLDPLVATVATADASGAALTGALRWPDGATGAFAIERDENSSVVGYTATHVFGGVTVTYTQPDVERDPVTGVVTERPAIVVS